VLNPEVVEVFPMYKEFDQVGPVELRRVARIIGFRLGINALENTKITYTMYTEDEVIQAGDIEVTPNEQKVYEVPYLPKTLKGTMFRMELKGNNGKFHRYFCEMFANLSGNDTEMEVIRL
jgi:hypothetical protein